MKSNDKLVYAFAGRIPDSAQGAVLKLMWGPVNDFVKRTLAVTRVR